MRIILVTPAGPRSRFGNRVTAKRWADVLRSLGHRVAVSTGWDGASADVLIALHAWRSAASIRRFRDRFPTRPLIVALTGTDIYGFLHTEPETTRRSLECADLLVGLHDLVGEALPPELRVRVRVVHQSVSGRSVERRPSKRTFDVCVVGHLRREKDPLRAAWATRGMPPDSRLRVLHAGGARDPEWAEAARREMARNPRYRWLGEVPAWRVRRLYERTHAMVISSLTEGGANVVSEAVMAGLPVIASRIPGNVGLLGPDHPGTFPPEDTDALGALLRRAESEPEFRAELTRHGARRAPFFAPKREREAWRRLLEELG
ncbi:MAG: selenoneine biosynthesis selenosugar synthase SenB [Acidobacteria bacterium]|nr:selenoneine biosynthesis selenosugar synthase SenB [Acidobacteriota bacterium]